MLLHIHVTSGQKGLHTFYEETPRDWDSLTRVNVLLYFHVIAFKNLHVNKAFHKGQQIAVSSFGIRSPAQARAECWLDIL